MRISIPRIGIPISKNPYFPVFENIFFLKNKNLDYENPIPNIRKSEIPTTESPVPIPAKKR
jgi:hypothetical protein